MAFPDWATLITSVNPHYWGFLGIGISVGISMLGAAWGMYIAGVSLVGAAVRAPRIRAKNLVSIIFCEAVGMYGVITGLVMSQKIHSLPDINWEGIELKGNVAGAVVAGWSFLTTGLTVAGSNVSSQLSIGTAGSGCALGDAQRPELFVRMLVVIFLGSSLGLFGVVAGAFQSSIGEFPDAAHVQF